MPILFINHPNQDLQEKIQNGSLSRISQERQNFYLAKILAFQMRFPDFYLHLRHHPGDWRYLEEEVILQKDATKRVQTLKGTVKLSEFWADASFQDFMSKTSKGSSQNNPPAPSSDIVEALLDATNLVIETPG